MIYGYIKATSDDKVKEIEKEIALLKKYGASKIVKETFTGSATRRPKLLKLIDTIKAGDVIVVTRLNQFGRNVNECIQLIIKLLRLKARVHIVNMGLLDENTFIGRFILAVLLEISELAPTILEKRENIISSTGGKNV